MAEFMAMSQPPAHKDITGISLHIENYGDGPSKELTFYKRNTSHVTIGRQSSVAGSQDSVDDSRALFRCPVISRRHAKITFTEFGNVFVSDLSSHHGTHILRPGDTVSTTIIPQQPTPLADGDVLTFGKTVGRDESLVRPVVAHVGLVYTPESSTSASDQPALASPSRPSGRYGVYDTGLTSSSSESDSEESDIEEAPMPPPNASPAYPCMTSPLFTPATSARLGLMRKILPRADSIEELTLSRKDSNRFSPISVSSSSSRSPSVVEVAPARLAEALRQLTPPPAPAPPLLSLDYEEVVDMDIERGGSFGPADTLPDGRDLSVVVASSELCVSEPQGNVFEDDNFSDMYATPAEPAEPVPSTIPLPPAQDRDFTPAFPSWDSSHFEFVSLPILPASSDFFSSRVEMLRSRLVDLEQRMQSQQPMPSQESSNADEGVTSDPIPEPPEAVLETKPEAELAAHRADVQVQVETRQREATPSRAPLSREAAESVDNLKELIQAFEGMRKKAEDEMQKELAAVRAVRIEAEAAVAAAKAKAAEPVVHASTMTGAEDCSTDRRDLNERATSLKRRRSDDEDQMADQIPSPAKRQRRSDTHFALAKRIAAGVAKTTAVAAVGAVATWSALAFS